MILKLILFIALISLCLGMFIYYIVSRFINRTKDIVQENVIRPIENVFINYDKVKHIPVPIGDVPETDIGLAHMPRNQLV